MELRIISPQEGGFIKEIQWNKEELKAWVAEKVKDYRGLVFTEATIPDAKKDRADLNKLKKAFEDERKRIKKLCLEPYEEFERQEKELIAMIDEPLQLIDCQIKEVEEKRKEEKRLRIKDLFSTIGFQAFVSLDMIWDELDDELNTFRRLGKMFSQSATFRNSALRLWRSIRSRWILLRQSRRDSDYPISRSERQPMRKRGAGKRKRRSRDPFTRRRNRRRFPRHRKPSRKRKKQRMMWYVWISVYGEPGTRSWV